MAERLPNYGRSGSLRARPAAQTPIEYGPNLLASRSPDWPKYALVTSPSAAAAIRPRLADHPPEVTIQITSLDFQELDRVAGHTPNVSLVVGAGGGQAIDAAKHIAATKRVPLVLAPTIVSSGAIVHGYLATFQGSKATGSRDDWVWSDSAAVLIDFDLVLSAPAHLNTAGLGDILCEYSGVAEWKLSNDAASRPRHSASELGHLVAFHHRLVKGFEATLDDGKLTPKSIECITESLRARDSHRIHLPSAPQVDHQFLAALEMVSERRWIHGEIVALGAVVVAWTADRGAASLCSRLDRCLVRWRPTELGMSRRDLEAALEALAVSLAACEGDPEHGSVMRDATWTKSTIDALWHFLNGET